MTNGREQKELIALVADRNMEFALRGLLSRERSLRASVASYDVFVHPEKDPGCFLKGPDFLRSFYRQYSYALVMFDREGCGREARTRTDLETDVENRLDQAGWSGRAAAIVIDPELENWVWAQSSHVELALGWGGRSPNLRQWLASEGLVATSSAKPSQPKHAMEQALRRVRRPRSSSLYIQLAKSVSLEGCCDEAFLKLRRTLSSWFQIEN